MLAALTNSLLPFQEVVKELPEGEAHESQHRAMCQVRCLSRTATT
jgi:hypothetical protein